MVSLFKRIRILMAEDAHPYGRGRSSPCLEDGIPSEKDAPLSRFEGGAKKCIFNDPYASFGLRMTVLKPKDVPLSRFVVPSQLRRTTARSSGGRPSQAQEDDRPKAQEDDRPIARRTAAP